MSDPIVTRVELLEGATSTLINKQDQMSAEMKRQFSDVNGRLSRIEQTLQLLVQMLNERLPGKPE
jgi:hypothetical protein